MKFKAELPCPRCKQYAELDLTDQQSVELEAWKAGNYRDVIQKALRSWPDEWREVLITGMDENCWNELMGDEED